MPLNPVSVRRGLNPPGKRATSDDLDRARRMLDDADMRAAEDRQAELDEAVDQPEPPSRRPRSRQTERSA